MKLTVRALSAIAGVSIMLCSSGCAKNEFKYSKYSNNNPPFNLSIDYLEGWKYVEYKDPKSGILTVLFTPTDKIGFFTAFISVEVVGPETLNAKVFSTAAAADLWESKEMKLPEAKLLKRSKVSINFATAEEINISYKMLERLHVKGAKALPSQAHLVVLKKGDRIFVSKLMATQEMFDRCDRAFGHMVRTLKQAK